MPKRKEVPFDPMSRAPRGMPLGVAAAESEIAALQAAAPHAEPEWSRERLLPMREVIADAIESLSPRERFVFDATVCERRSVRELGRAMSLSKSQVDRIKHQAVAKLAEVLGDDPLVKEYLNR